MIRIFFSNEKHFNAINFYQTKNIKKIETNG